MTTVSIAQLHEYFRPFFKREQISKKQPLSLAQRTLNNSRVKKLTQYILQGCLPQNFYVLPPVTVTIDIPESESYEFYGVEFDDDDFDLSNSSTGFTSEFGTLSLPTTTQFWLADGQHRIAGAIQAYLDGAALVGQETIGMMLLPDTDGSKRKRIFLDINKHTAKPSQSIIALFDNNDPHCDIAREILTNVTIFEGRTALEGTNARGDDLWTMNNLKECSQIFSKGLDRDLVATAIEFWQAVADHHPDWKNLDTKEADRLRAETISFHAITMNAIALIGNQQIKAGRGFEWLKELQKINWSAHNSELEGICRFGGRITKNRKTAIALAKYFMSQLEA